MKRSIAVGLIALCAVHAAGAEDFRVGDAVDALRGDKWEPATVVRVDGTLVMVRFKDNKTLFCAPEKVRGKGGAAVAPATPSGPASPKPGGGGTTLRNRNSQSLDEIRIGDQVEFCDEFFWRKGKLLDRKNGWVFVSEEGGWRKNLWLEPWRVRAVGSKDAFDTRNAGKINEKERSNANRPPKDPPGPPPVPSAGSRSRPDLNRPWKSVADPSPAPPSAVTPMKRGVFLLSLPEADDVNAQNTVLGATEQHLIAVVAMQKEKSLFVEVIDRASGKSRATVLPLTTFPAALTPAGDLVAMSGPEGEALPMIFAITQPDPAPKILAPDLKDVKQFHPFSADKTLIEHRQGLRLVKHDSPKPAWENPASDLEHMALTPGGKFVLATHWSEGYVRTLDARTGALISAVAANTGDGADVVAFPDGKRFACYANDVLEICDAETGKSLNRIVIGDRFARGGLHLIDDTHLLAGLTLVDLTTQRLVARINEHVIRSWYADRGVLALVKDKEMLLLRSEPPLTQLEMFASDAPPDPRDVLFGPGSKFNIVFEAETDEATKTKSIELLKERIAQAGHTFDPAAPLTIKVTTERKPAHEATFVVSDGFGRTRGPEFKLTLRPMLTRIAYVLDGQTYEQATGLLGDGNLSQEENESPQQAADRAGRFDADLIKRFVIPTQKLKKDDLREVELGTGGFSKRLR